MIGIGPTNASPLVAPALAKAPLIGTNPIASPLRQGGGAPSASTWPHQRRPRQARGRGAPGRVDPGGVGDRRVRAPYDGSRGRPRRRSLAAGRRRADGRLQRIWPWPRGQRPNWGNCRGSLRSVDPALELVSGINGADRVPPVVHLDMRDADLDHATPPTARFAVGGVDRQTVDPGIEAVRIADGRTCSHAEVNASCTGSDGASSSRRINRAIPWSRS